MTPASPPRRPTTGTNPSADAAAGPAPDPSAGPSTADASPPRRRPRARKGEGSRLRDEIMEAAERLLLSTGSAENVSVRSVAEAVGVTPPSIYRHFADKETLIAEVCARHFETLDAEVERAVAGLDDPVERLIARGAAYMRFGVANPEPYRILFMTPTKTVEEQRQQKWLAESKVFADTLDNVIACQEAGRLRPEHPDPYHLALTLWAQVHGLTSLAISKPFIDDLRDDDFIDRFADACVRGIVVP